MRFVWRQLSSLPCVWQNKHWGFRAPRPTMQSPNIPLHPIFLGTFRTLKHPLRSLCFLVWRFASCLFLFQSTILSSSTLILPFTPTLGKIQVIFFWGQTFQRKVLNFFPIAIHETKLFRGRSEGRYFKNNSLFHSFLKCGLWTPASESHGELKATEVGIGPGVQTLWQALQNLRTLLYFLECKGASALVSAVGNYLFILSLTRVKKSDIKIFVDRRIQASSFPCYTQVACDFPQPLKEVDQVLERM